MYEFTQSLNDSGNDITKNDNDKIASSKYQTRPNDNKCMQIAIMAQFR